MGASFVVACTCHLFEDAEKPTSSALDVLSDIMRAETVIELVTYCSHERHNVALLRSFLSRAPITL